MAEQERQTPERVVRDIAAAWEAGYTRIAKQVNEVLKQQNASIAITDYRAGSADITLTEAQRRIVFGLRLLERMRLPGLIEVDLSAIADLPPWSVGSMPLGRRGDWNPDTRLEQILEGFRRRAVKPEDPNFWSREIVEPTRINANNDPESGRSDSPRGLFVAEREQMLGTVLGWRVLLNRLGHLCPSDPPSGPSVARVPIRVLMEARSVRVGSTIYENLDPKALAFVETLLHHRGDIVPRKLMMKSCPELRHTDLSKLLASIRTKFPVLGRLIEAQRGPGGGFRMK